MKWCVSFPEESVLVVRPCLNTICAGVKPAAKLLSVLLYRYSIRQEHKEDAENINEARATKGEEANQDTTFRIYRKQAQLVTDMCNEITEKTLHDVAVPTLQLLGFLDVDESSPVHCYDVHQDIVTEALAALKQGPKQLEKFLISHLQLEKFLITIPSEKVLINKKFFQFNKKYFQLVLEKVLIANRNSSNNKRGRKPSPEATSEGVFEDPQISIEISNKITEEETERERIPAPESDATFSPPHVGERSQSSQSDTQFHQQGDDNALLDNPSRVPGVSASGDAGKDSERAVLPVEELDKTFSEKADIDPDETLHRIPAIPKQTVSTSQPAQSTELFSVPSLPQEVKAEQAASGPSTKGKGKKAAEPAKPELTPEGETLYQDWCSLFHVTIPRTKAIILAANDLYEPIAYWSGKLSIPRSEVLKRIMNWQYKNNPNYYGEGRGVKLFDVQRDIEGWISAAERKLARDALKVVPAREDKSGQFNMGPIVLESHRQKGGLRGKALAPAH